MKNSPIYAMLSLLTAIMVATLMLPMIGFWASCLVGVFLLFVEIYAVAKIQKIKYSK